ncbi:MAG: RNA polymerase subunit sigma, partial [Polyangiaceae bacterium]|nr:RNA polymerase subunit sigma [Polyangiaceae bacterium]
LEAGDVSLDQQVYGDSTLSIVDTLEGDLEQQDEALARRTREQALSARLEGALRVLDRRERYIVERRILSDSEMSLAALGRELGVSRERARQLEARAKAKLKLELSEFAPAA